MWDPEEGDWEALEAKYTRKHRMDMSSDGASHQTPVATTVPYTSDVRLVNPAFSGKRKLDIPDDVIRRRFGNVPKEVVDETLNHTTQLAKRCGEMPLHRRFKTKFTQLGYR